MKHVGLTLKAIIEDNRLQKNTIAIRAGITPTYLSAIMRKSSIDCELLERICNVIGVRPSMFFDDGVYVDNSNTVSNVHAEALVNATVNISQGEVEALKKMIEEKERTIQILMKSKGLDVGSNSGQKV